MQDRKIHNFLKQYFRVFLEGFVYWIHEYETNQSGEHAIGMQDLIVPTMFKNLGDGMMLVWEIPQNLDIQSQGLVVMDIFDAIDNMKAHFYSHFRNLAPAELDAYSTDVEKLEIGFGIAKGHAWKLDFGSNIDYAGSIINLASRLQSFARPKGIVAQYDLAPFAFETMKETDGQITVLSSIPGFDEVKVWATKDVAFNT